MYLYNYFNYAFCNCLSINYEHMCGAWCMLYIYCIYCFYAPAPLWWAGIKCLWPSCVCLFVCLSVCLSVCPVPDPKSRMKIGRREANCTGELWPNLKVKGQSFQTWYRVDQDDPHHRHARWRQSKVKVIRSCRQSDACVAITRQWKVAKKIKIGRTVIRTTADIPHQFQGQQVKGQGHQSVWYRDRKSDISSEWEPTNFKLSIRWSTRTRITDMCDECLSTVEHAHSLW